MCNVCLHMTLIASISVFKVLKRRTNYVVAISFTNKLESKAFLDYLGHYLGWFMFESDPIYAESLLQWDAQCSLGSFNCAVFFFFC